MKVVVIGANGQLGADLSGVAAGHGEVLPLTHEDVEIADLAAVRAGLGGGPVDLVINTAALHNVDLCEEQPAAAFAVNSLGARNVAVAAREAGAAVVHLSTDYVFGGEKRSPYDEADLPAPLSVYGTTKLGGEHFVRANNPRHFIVRTSALYGVSRCRAKSSDNFVRLMLRLGREKGEVRVVTDERVSPTWTADLAKQIFGLAATPHFGVYHATSQGDCTWFDFARTIFDLAGLSVKMEPITARRAASQAPRPAYSVLDNAALRAIGLDRMPRWRDSLEGYLTEIGELAPSATAAR